MIHVCYALRDESGKYSKFVGTSIQSLLDNTKSEVTVHILHDSTLTLANQQKLQKIIYTHGQEVMFYNVEKLATEKLQMIDANVQGLSNKRDKFSAFYRYMIPDLLPQNISRVIYLDADTVVNLEIAELWNVDMNWFPLAAVTQAICGASKEITAAFNPLIREEILKFEDYFNSGVLLIDLARFRIIEQQGSILERCLTIRKEWGSKNKLFDQDALNFIFRENYLKLPAKFNRLVHVVHQIGKPKNVGREIIHYSAKTCRCNFEDDYNLLWFKYFCRTPFYSTDSFMSFMEKSQNSALQTNLLWRRIANLPATRAHGFFIYPKDLEEVINIIGKNDNDIGLNAEFPNALDNLISTMEEYRGKIVFFINVPMTEYSSIRKKLNELDFEEYTDFLNVKALDPNLHGYRMVLDL